MEQINHESKTTSSLLNTSLGFKNIIGSISTSSNNLFTKVPPPGLNTAYSFNIYVPGLEQTLLNNFCFETLPAVKLLSVPPGFKCKELANNDKLNYLKETACIGNHDEKNTKDKVPPPGFINIQPKCGNTLSLDVPPGFNCDDLLQNVSKAENF